MSLPKPLERLLPAKQTPNFCHYPDLFFLMLLLNQVFFFFQFQNKTNRFLLDDVFSKTEESQSTEREYGSGMDNELGSFAPSKKGGKKWVCETRKQIANLALVANFLANFSVMNDRNSFLGDKRTRKANILCTVAICEAKHSLSGYRVVARELALCLTSENALLTL